MNKPTVRVNEVPEGTEKDRILKAMRAQGIAPISLEQLEAFLANHPLPLTVCNLPPKSESSMPADTTK